MDDWKVVSDIAGTLTATPLLLYGLWALITGKLKTSSHHEEVVAQHVKSEDRAWEMVEKTNTALAANNAVLEKFAESLGDLRDAVNSLRATVDAAQRVRR